MSRSRVAVTGLTILLAPPLLAAQPTRDPNARERFENIEFKPPAGWRVDRSMVLVPFGRTQGEESLLIFLLNGRRSSSPLREELDSTWVEIGSRLKGQLTRTINGGFLETDDSTRSLAGWTYIQGSGTVVIDGKESTVRAFLIRAGDRVERIFAVARHFGDNVNTTNAMLNPRFDRDLRELVFTMRFANMPAAPPATASIRGGEITGVWSGVAMSGGSQKIHHAIFFSNGTAYFGPSFPVRGLVDIDPAVEQAAARRYWGTYTFTGGAGVLTMPYGTIPLRRDGSALELTVNRTPRRYARLSMPDTASIAGEWCLSANACLRLTGGATGRFTDLGAVRVLEHSTYVFPESPTNGAGQYELRDHTLVLRYDRGPEIRVAVPGVSGGAPAKPSELMLSFNLDVLTRR